MASNRIQRINEDISRELAALMRNVKDPRLTATMLTITGVETTSDLRYAKVYVSPLGQVDEKELKKGLKSVSGYLRHALGERLNLRYTPELIFELDHSIAHGAHIARLIQELEETQADTGAADEGEDHAD